MQAGDSSGHTSAHGDGICSAEPLDDGEMLRLLEAEDVFSIPASPREDTYCVGWLIVFVSLIVHAVHAAQYTAPALMLVCSS